MSVIIKKIKPPVLRPHEEEEILDDIINKAKKGEPVLRQDVERKVLEFIMSDKRKNPFRNGTPGDKWFSLFRRRHNRHFLKLKPHELKAVEQVGFTEKVMNTVSYPRPPVVQKSPIVIRKRSAGLTKTGVKCATRVQIHDMSASQKTPVAMSSPMSDESCHTNATDDGDTCKSQESMNDSNDFQPGSRLEVMDFNDKWYAVKVVEVDYEEGEVLVHYEKWSDRYDEWVRMDSNRIRRPVATPMPSSKKVFEENEKVIAVWAYNHKYPATVRQVLPNDKYEVLFCDGYAKTLRGCKLFKASEDDLKNCKLPPPKKPAPPMGADPLDPDLGPKEERRLKKRRMDVLESYRPHKKHQSDTPQSETESPPRPPMSTYKPKEMPKVVLKMRGRPPKRFRVKIEESVDEDDDNGWVGDDDDDDNYDDSNVNKSEDVDEDGGNVNNDDDNENDEDEQEQEPEYTIRRPKKKFKKRRKGKATRGARKKPFDESTYEYRGVRRPGLEENSERWNTDIPEGVSPVQIKDNEGFYRESVIIPDKKLPAGWAKHTMRRKNGAKWDVFLVNPDGRKFRSRNELRTYFGEINEPFPEDSFDFMVGRKMEMIRTQKVEYKKTKLHPDIVIQKRTSFHKRSLHKRSALQKRLLAHKGSPAYKTSDGEGHSDGTKSMSDNPDGRRIKTMLPKSRNPDQPDGVKNEQSPVSSPSRPTLLSPPFPLTELRTPDGGFTCCGKTFRKENFFQMHMKHYHPQYSNLFGSTPNVADLAYARTVGEPLEDSRAEAMTPKSSIIERVNKYEAERKALSDSLAAQSEPSGTKSVQDQEFLPATQTVAEQPTEPTVKQTEEHLRTVKEECIEDDVSTEEPIETEKPMLELDGEDAKEPKENNVATPQVPVEEIKKEILDEVKEDSVPAATTEQPTTVVPSTPTTPRPPTPGITPVTSSIPVIKPVSKLTNHGSSKVTITSDAVIVQTASSPKTPVMITKYIPPGQKPATSVTKMTISLTTPPIEKETKPTIKTLLPLRPPPPEPKETPEAQKPKETKSKEEVDEETPIKSRPRKRTVSESLPKKPKLVKPSTGSLEEEPVETAPVAPSLIASSTSYRFSRNRSQVPCVALEKLNVTTDINGRVVLTTPEDKISNTAGVESSHELPASATFTEPVYDNLRKEEIINCTCGYMEEDGLMIQCDLCLCWQHGLCNNIDKEADVPEKYVCSICLNPTRQRASTKHLHNQDWLKEGKLPSLSFLQKNEEDVMQRESMLKKSHDLVSSLLQLKTIIRSLRVKTHIATKPNHPKLYLWDKSWKDENPENKIKNEEESNKAEVLGPQPEAAIDQTECRLRLLEHVEDYQQQVDDRLTSIQAQIAALESEDPDLASDEASDHYPATKQTVQMILHDLNTMRKVAALD